MRVLRNLATDVLQIFYPRHCNGCGSDLLSPKGLLCVHCINALPHTNFASQEGNSIERIFAGRIPLVAAFSEFYFSKGQLIQQLIHQLKYRNNKEIGHWLGEAMGNSIKGSGRFSNIDYLLPLPLYADKEFRRGYNQATIICNGISVTSGIPVMATNVIRRRATETQTKKHRTERWQNVAGSFIVTQPGKLINKSVLLVDDVITTGASLEACAQSMLQIPGIRVSIAALAHASK